VWLHSTSASHDAWQTYVDPASGNPYYYHVESKTTTWECPPELEGQSHEDPLGARTARAVPASSMARVLGFASLGADLAAGAALEMARRAAGGGTPGSTVLNPRNADVLATELCRMRGAALKIGQMLSVQDESFLPTPIAEALKRVRTHADIMPAYQLEQVLVEQLGPEWEAKFAHFGRQPVAAASIGQVHMAALHDGREVAVKVQYPGVATSINSDLANLERLVSVLNVAPQGLFIERIIEVAR
jgi:aarF domain-containing kinase